MINIDDLTILSMDATLSPIDQQLNADLHIVNMIEIEDYIREHSYEGSYAVESSFSDTVLPTKHKFLSEDIKIDRIAQSETSNPSGGYTLYIGKE